jgi:hypothetical protein
MASQLLVDLFAEDQAHEQFMGALIRRLAKEYGKDVEVHMRSARGGHGRAITELNQYQRSFEKYPGLLVVPDVLVVAIDANCKRLSAARKEILAALNERFRNLAAIACPDPHVERWYVADPGSFKTVVGVAPKCARRKCERKYYKNILSRAVADAGHVPTLGGIEFAQDLVDAMDIDRAAKTDRSLKAFIDDMRTHFKNP